MALYQLVTNSTGPQVAAWANANAEALAVLDAAPAGKYIIPATSTQASDTSSPRWFQSPSGKTFKIKSVTVSHASAIPYVVTYTLFRKNLSSANPLFVALTDIVVPSNSTTPITLTGSSINSTATNLILAPTEGIFFLQQNNIPEGTTASPNLTIKVLLTPQ
jgi:hypothetical protein